MLAIVVAAVAGVFLGRRCMPLRLALVLRGLNPTLLLHLDFALPLHLLLAGALLRLHLGLALLLHLLLAGALLRLHLGLALLLRLLLAYALLGLQLGLALLLHLLLAGTLLRLHLGFALLLRLLLAGALLGLQLGLALLLRLLAYALLRLQLGLALLLRGAGIRIHRSALDGTYHRQPLRLRRVGGTGTRWPHRLAWFTGVRKSRTRQCAGPARGRLRLHARRDRVHGVLERLGRIRAAWRGGTRGVFLAWRWRRPVGGAKR
ncbi:MAG TPA: hypothetical protein VFL63_13120, partial [Rhodanobacteraceae bacterium]|nr:hypothetical protein [Rhodanobacteraceae bacterium]